MSTLITSYEKLKGKFNNFASKCLSDRQKRESGLILIAPQLLLPTDKEQQDAESPLPNFEEAKDTSNSNMA